MNTRRAVGYALIGIAVLLTLVLFGTDYLTISPTNQVIDCALWGKQDGLCITNAGESRSLLQPQFSLLGYSGQDAIIYVGDVTMVDGNVVRDISGPMLDLMLENFDLKMAAKEIGVGSACEVQVSIQACVKRGTADQLFDDCTALDDEYYPEGAKEGTWLKGVLIANPAKDALSGETILLYSNAGKRLGFTSYQPYICKTDYDYPAVEMPLIVDDKMVRAALYDIKIRIYSEESQPRWWLLIPVGIMLVLGIFLLRRQK